MRIDICFSCDDKYVQHLAVTIASILYNAKGDEYHFHILDGGISRKNKKRIEDLRSIKGFDVEFMPVNYDEFKDCPITGYVDYISKPTYFRFKIPSMLKDVDKVLYLDCDIVVLKDIAELFGTDMDGKCMGAIPDTANHWHKARISLGDKNRLYCNAGILLINNKRCRELGVEDRLFSYARNPEQKITFQDQDVINIVLADEIKYLPIKWNVMHDALCTSNPYPELPVEHDYAVKNPHIVHFTNPQKPWNSRCKNPYRKSYYKFLKKTPFKGSYYKIKVKQFPGKIMRTLFSVRKDSDRKVICVLGMRFKSSYKFRKDDFYHEINIIKNQLKDVNEELKARLDEIGAQIRGIKESGKPAPHDTAKATDEVREMRAAMDLVLSHAAEMRNGGRAPSERLETYGLALREIGAGSRILDAACGIGDGTALLGAEADVMGIDANPYAIEFAQKAFGGKNVSFICGATSKTGMTEGFDGAVLFRADGISGAEQALSGIRNALKSGGKLVVSARNESAGAMKELLEKLGFSVGKTLFLNGVGSFKANTSGAEGGRIICIAKKK